MNITPFRFNPLNTTFKNTQTRNNHKTIYSNIYDTITFTRNSKDISEISKKHNTPVKIVFTDIDGTIADKGVVPKSAKEALFELKKEGIPIVITTGRVFAGAKKKIKQMGLNLSDKDFVITQQGTVIRNGNGEILYKKTIELEDALAVIRTAENYTKDTKDRNFNLIVYIDGIPYIKTNDKSIGILEALYRTDSFYELIQQKGLPTKMILYKKDSKKPSDMNEMKEYFQKALEGHNLNLFVTKEDFCEITNGETSKGAAASKVAQITGVGLENAACLGDAENDLALMEIINEAGGVSVAMGNAQKSVKDMAKFITGKVSEDGYKNAIEAILENNQRFDR